jgi:hypothetical protein
MKLFGDVTVLRGSVSWTKPFRPRVTPAAVGDQPANSAAVTPEYDEDGRLYVFRYTRSAPQQYAIERDRIFEYIKRRRLPTAGQRRIRRDVRNCADFFADVRELQYEYEVTPYRRPEPAEGASEVVRLRKKRNAHAC